MPNVRQHISKVVMLEPVDQQYVLLGRIARAQGVQGTILLIPEVDAPALFDDIDLVRLQDARGDLVPARIESVRVQQKNNRLSFFVKFDHISDRNQANAIKNFAVYIKRDKVLHLLDDTSVPDFISFNIVDETREDIGTVVDITGNPVHPVLTVKTPGGDLLIPLVDEYVSEIDEKQAVIHCRHLDQLSAL